MPRNDGNTQKRPNKPMNNQNLQKKQPKNRNKNYKNNPPQVKADNGKTKPFIAKCPPGKCGPAYEYKMSRECANDILKECPSHTKPQQYLCDYVNEQYGLLGYCCKVIIIEG